MKFEMTEEMIEVMNAFTNGKKVYRIPRLARFSITEDSNPSWNWEEYTYILDPILRSVKKPLRLLTVKELWDKTLINSAGGMFIVNCVLPDGYIAGLTGRITIKELHENGWKLATTALEYDKASSLTVQ